MQLPLDQDQRFRWGIGLAWVPLLIIYFLGLKNAFRGISSSKATGLGAVAGGLAESMIVFGFVSLLVTQAGAILLLFRSFSRKHLTRGILASLSIGLSLLTLALMGMALWLAIYFRPR